MSCSTSVVLPLPDQPANPKTRITPAICAAAPYRAPAFRPWTLVWLRRAAADDRVDELALGVGIAGGIAGTGLENRALPRLIGIAQFSVHAQNVAEPIERLRLRRFRGDDMHMKPVSSPHVLDCAKTHRAVFRKLVSRAL